MTTFTKAGTGAWGSPDPNPVIGDTTSYIDDLGLIIYDQTVGSELVQTNRDKYGMVLIQGSSSGALDDAWAAAAGKVVKYGWFIGPRGPTGLGPTETTARSSGWLMHSSATADPSAEMTFGFTKVADPGNAFYQAACLSAIQTYLATHPTVEGIWIDVFSPDMGEFGMAFPVYDQTGSLLYSNNTQWQDALIEYALNVYGPVKAAGDLVILNAGARSWTSSDHGHLTAGVTPTRDGTTTLDWMNLLKSYSTGITDEHWLNNQSAGREVVALNNHATAFDWWTEMVAFQESLQAAGQGFYPAHGYNLTSTSVTRYLRASFLMGWDGGPGAYILGRRLNGGYSSGGTDEWNSEFATDPGQPLSARVAVGSCWKRSYEHYVVYINPTASIQTPDGHSIPSGDALFV